MKLLILGATGPLGQQLVKQAVGSGEHDIKVLVRSPEKLADIVSEDTNKKLEVIEGSVYNAEDMRKAMADCDAILSALGGKPGIFTACDIYSKTGDVIVEVMKELKVKRFIVCTAWGTKDDPRLSFLYRYVFKPTLLRNVNADMGRLEDMLQTTQPEEINWTVVKPPMLSKDPLSGRPPLTYEGYLVPNSPKDAISRADLAKFMLDCLQTSEWDRKLVAVAGGVPEKPAAKQAEANKAEEKPDETKQAEGQAEEKPVEAKSEEKAEEKPVETKSEEKAEEKPVETKSEEKAEEKPVETKSEEKAEEKLDEAKSEEQAEDKPNETKSEEKAEEKPTETKSEEAEESEVKPKEAEAKAEQ